MCKISKDGISGQTEEKACPIMLVVASDPMLFKLLTMALPLELACEVLTINSARSVEQAAKHLRLDLLIIDERLINDKAYDLSDRLHRITGLEHLPTLFLNVTLMPSSESKYYPSCFLQWPWKIEALYAAVRSLLPG